MIETDVMTDQGADANFIFGQLLKEIQQNFPM